jgi:tRNA nucleotidyltransferase (CCA-adding enzyme)
MSKQNDLFDQFLSNIEPDTEAINYAQKAHQPVRDFLEKDMEFGPYFVDSFLYGSYKRHTAVGDIKDIDIVILTSFDPNSDEGTPQNVLRQLKSALARYY